MELLIKNLITSYVVVSGLFLHDAYRKEKKTFGRYAFQFIGFFIIFYAGDLLFRSKVEATNVSRDDSIGYFDDQFLDKISEKQITHEKKLEQLRHEFYQNQMILCVLKFV